MFKTVNITTNNKIFVNVPLDIFYSLDLRILQARDYNYQQIYSLIHPTAMVCTCNWQSYNTHNATTTVNVKIWTFSPRVVKIFFCLWLILTNGDNKTHSYAHTFKDTCTQKFRLFERRSKRTNISTFTVYYYYVIICFAKYCSGLAALPTVTCWCSPATHNPRWTMNSTLSHTYRLEYNYCSQLWQQKEVRSVSICHTKVTTGFLRNGAL